MAALKWFHGDACRGVRGASVGVVLGHMAWKAMDDGDGNEVYRASAAEIAEGAKVSRATAEGALKLLIGEALEVVEPALGSRPATYRLKTEATPEVDAEAPRRSAVVAKSPGNKDAKSPGNKSTVVAKSPGNNEEGRCQVTRQQNGRFVAKSPGNELPSHPATKGGYTDEDIKTQDQDMSEPLSRSDAAGESDPPKSKSTTPEGAAANRIARLLKQDLEARGKVVTVTKSSAAIVTQNLKALIKQHGADDVADTYAKATTADLGAWPWGGGLATITSANGYDAIANGNTRRGRRGPTQVDDLPDYSSEEYTRGATLVYHMDEEDDDERPRPDRL